MEPAEIFDLIVRADEALKYATDDKAAPRRGPSPRIPGAGPGGSPGHRQRRLGRQAEQRLEDLRTLEA
jgi:hypothetical protein